MSDTRMKNAYFLCSIISFTLIIFSNCTSQTNQSLSIGEASKIVEAKCEEYEKSYLVQQSSCSSGSTYSDYRTETEEKEFPHMAAIGYEIDNVIAWQCGGSLISERFVLSAAHCAYYMRTKAKLVLLGATSLQAIDQNSNAVNYTIIDWIFHPRYDAESNFLKHDIVLFKLDDDVKFSAFVRPICLATFSSSPPKTAVITGYGKYRTGMMNPSGKLLKGNVKIEQNKEACLDDFKDSKLYKNPINASTIICTQNEKRITQDGCYGDSGGPMQTQKNKNICFYELHGIVSSGPYICGDSSRPYSIYTNVSSYIDWIQQEVWPDN